MSLAGIAALLFLAAATASALLCGATRKIAPIVGLVDKPGGRKAHKAPTPLGGGVAFTLAQLTLGRRRRSVAAPAE